MEEMPQIISYVRLFEEIHINKTKKDAFGEAWYMILYFKNAISVYFYFYKFE